MELERRGVQDLASAIAAAESLIELKRDSLKARSKNGHSDSDSEGDRDHSPKKHRPPLHHKGNGKKEEAPKKYTCFLCNGPHRVFECPKRGRLSALVMEEERKEEEGRIASMSLLSTLQTKVGEQPGGRMYVEAEVEGKKLQATVDTGADTVYMAKELADEICLPYKKKKGYIKGVNAKSLPIHGIARGADIRIGPWRGKIDITVAPLDDRKFYLGMDFLDKARASIVPHASTLFITADGQVHAIPMKRDVKKERVLPALQFLKDHEPGHLAALKRDEGPMCVKASTPPRKKAPRKKGANRKTRCKHERGRSAEKKASSHSKQVQATSPGKAKEARHDQAATRTLPSLVGEDVTDRSRMHRNPPELSGFI